MTDTPLTGAEALTALAILVAPWALVAIIALVRGYSVKFWRDPHHHRDDDPEPPVS